MRLRIVAVSGSPVRGGNVEAFMDHALDEYREKENIEVKRFYLSRLEVGPCGHCNWCMKNQADGRYCAVEDDMALIHPELLMADGLIIASPVHFLRLSAQTACFIDRLRVYRHGNITRGAMRNKVGGALAVSWFRNTGVELTLLTINAAFQVLTMVVADPDQGILGAGGLSSLEGTGGIIREGRRLHVTEDDFGLTQARSLAGRVAELAAMMRTGREASKNGIRLP